MALNNKPHIKLNTSKQTENTVGLKFNYGAPDDEEDEDDEKERIKNYRQMATSFRGYLTRLSSDYSKRVAERNLSLEIPEHIDYIKILFQNQFSIKDSKANYYQSWYNEFGLLGVNFSKFNHEVLFAIIDRDKFQLLINSINNFIAKEIDNKDVKYSAKVKYIKEFKLLTTADIIQFRDAALLLNCKLIDFPFESKEAKNIYASLTKYLSERGIEYRLITETSNLEVYKASEAQAQEIAENFDIVYSVTSALATVISPSEFNLEQRDYGFTVANGEEDLPIIGILDTGISNKTPLDPILIKDESFNLTSSSVFEDTANGGYGHGTAIAALAALGRDPYLYGNFRGNYEVDAKLLSMKILDNDSGFISELDVLQLLRNSKAKYPKIKIFVLTICYSTHKRTNEDFSTYAYELDRFAHENDCLIFICTANNSNAALHNSAYDLNYFFSEATNLCCPADSLNNVIVGAAAHSIIDGAFSGISLGKEYPAIYSRKSHVDLSPLFPKIKRNKNYFRPDVIECGGDYEQSGNFIGSGLKASINVLSSNPTVGFYKHTGTSFAAPLTANIAAKIQRFYPELRAQTIKALIVNAASLNNIRFEKPLSSLLNKTAGHGFVDPDNSVLSNDNKITFVIEDAIKPEDVKIVPLNFPQYLSKEDLGKRKGLLKVTATLCFSFDPVLNNQLAYCPIHMAYSFFRNHPGEDILKKEDDVKSKLRSTLTWSQNGRYKAKPIPCFNTQKLNFRISVDDLISEESTLKLAVNCRINPQLLPGLENKYKKEHPFSLVITISEDLPTARQTGRLYAEMTAINHVENIASIDLENNLDAVV